MYKACDLIIGRAVLEQMFGMPDSTHMDMHIHKYI